MPATGGHLQHPESRAGESVGAPHSPAQLWDAGAIHHVGSLAQLYLQWAARGEVMKGGGMVRRRMQACCTHSDANAPLGPSLAPPPPPPMGAAASTHLQRQQLPQLPSRQGRADIVIGVPGLHPEPGLGSAHRRPAAGALRLAGPQRWGSGCHSQRVGRVGDRLAVACRRGSTPPSHAPRVGLAHSRDGAGAVFAFV